MLLPLPAPETDPETDPVLAPDAEADSSEARAPATCGAAMEVPDMVAAAEEEAIPAEVM